MGPSSLTALAEQLLNDSRLLDSYNEANGLEPVSFDHESFVDLLEDIEDHRKNVINIAQDLKRLAQGPRDLLFETLNTFNDLANFHFIYHHKIPQYIPLGDISYAELAVATGLDEILLRRMLHHAMIYRTIAESNEGRIQHSIASRMLKEDSEAMDAAGFLLEELFMVGAMEKYPNSGEPNETGFNMAFNTSRPFYLKLEATPKGLMVDVGGGHGAVSMALAKATTHMNFVVQDLPNTATQGEKLLPTSLQGRVSFMAHDFFEEQPVKCADVYFLRYILHNWSDKYARRILKSLIPALKDSSRIVCYEFLPGDRPTTLWTEKQPLNMNMIQAIGWNSIERTASDWKRLFSSVDKRLRFLGTRTPPGCSVSLIKAEFHLGANGATTQ
ncbi:putative O-methyltransferase [Glonium stellatum]|uniref:Putative O-methyltransferase n=1 Tax=Glonium stellatum TaxID=574774 RepID=A0A8E2FEK5_9PEZI|nr:putative O-methyltransferase [Glonium stellatum]